MLTHQFISELIAATRTDTGHTVRCRLDQATYPKGIIVTDDQLAAVNITRGAFHGEWNYTIAPRTTELVEPSPEPIAVIIAVRPLSGDPSGESACCTDPDRHHHDWPPLGRNRAGFFLLLTCAFTRKNVAAPARPPASSSLHAGR